MLRRLALGWAAVLFGITWSSAVLADDEETPPPPHPLHRIQYDSLTGVRINPIGVETAYNLAYRLRFYESDSLALRDNYLGIGISPTLSPAQSRFGGTVEVRPLTVLALSAGFYHVGFPGSFGHLQSYETANEEHSDTDLDEGKDADQNYPTSGWELQLRALALAKVGPIAIRSDLNVYASDLDLRGDDRLYYTPRQDLMVPDRGWFLTSDTDLVYLSDFGLIAGVRNTLAHAFYRDEDLAVADENPNTPTFRLGPVVGFTFFDDPGASFNKPTALLIAQWWLSHRYRTGEDVSQGLPLIAVAFRFEGDLWRSK
jgi:hypothetical protein